MSPSLHHAGDILKLSGSYWACFTLHAGVNLGLFSQLAEGPQTAESLAESLGCDLRGTATLADALCAQGLLIKRAGRYENGPLATRHLVSGADGYLGHIITHHSRLVPQWHKLDEAVRTGRPTRPPRDDAADAEAGREAFLMGMHNLVMQLAPKAAAGIDLGGAARLLDLGGGPGTWAIHFCLAHPELRATVFDLPTSRAYAEANIARFGLGDRVDFQGGDFLQQDIEGRYDAVWMSQILHSFGPEDCRTVIGRAVGALAPGGRILIHEFLLDDDRTSPAFPTLFSLNMFTGTTAGRAYAQSELEQMLRDAGAQDIGLLDFKAGNDSRILAGRIG